MHRKYDKAVIVETLFLSESKQTKLFSWNGNCEQFKREIFII